MRQGNKGVPRRMCNDRIRLSVQLTTRDRRNQQEHQCNVRLLAQILAQRSVRQHGQLLSRRSDLQLVPLPSRGLSSKFGLHGRNNRLGPPLNLPLQQDLSRPGPHRSLRRVLRNGKSRSSIRSFSRSI